MNPDKMGNSYRAGHSNALPCTVSSVDKLIDTGTGTDALNVSDYGDTAGDTFTIDTAVLSITRVEFNGGALLGDLF